MLVVPWPWTLFFFKNKKGSFFLATNLGQGVSWRCVRPV